MKIQFLHFANCILFSLLLLSNVANAQSGRSSNKSNPWHHSALDEIISLRNQHAKHFKNADGTNTMFTSPSSLHYKQDEQWKEIDVNITPNPSDSKQKFPYCNTENQFKSYFPSNPFSGNVLTTLQEGNMSEHVEEVFAVDAQGNKVYNYPASSNPLTSLHESQIMYQNAFNGMDIRYTQEADGRKFDLILKDKNCLEALPSNAQLLVIQEKLSLPLGWTISSSENGIDIYAGKKWMANFPSPIAFELNNENRKDDDGMKEGNIHFFKKGNDVFIETSFSIAWLRKSDRNFPVTLDPVTSYYPSNLSMATGNMTSATGFKNSGNIRLASTGSISWAQFDLSSLPTFANISSATYWGNHFNSTGVPSKMSAIVGLQTVNPISATNTSIYNQIISTGPVYNNTYTFGGLTVPQWYSGAINSNGISDINSQLSQGWTAIGFKYLSGVSTTMIQYGYNAAIATNRPYLEITYTTIPCSGTPNASTATSSISSSCGLPFTLTCNGIGVESGYMYQWQSSPSGLNAWINVGASSSTKSLSISQTIARDYQCIVTCTNSGLSTTSSIVTVGQSTAILNSSSLTACNSYSFEGTTYTTSGIYSHTFTNPGGCDSIHTLNLTINYGSTASSFNASNCSAYTWAGITYTLSGFYTRFFTNINGCDSVREMFLTINTNNSPQSTKAFIANQSSNNVMVFNLADNSLVATIPVGAMPQEITIHPDKSKVYVGNWNGASISVISTTNNTVSSTISLGASDRPEGLCMSLDGTKLYAAIDGINPSSVKVFNTSTNALLATITIGNSVRALAISPDGATLYAANSTSNTISVISTFSNSVMATIAVGNGPEGLAISPDGTKLYVALRTAGTVQVINTSTNAIMNTITVGSQPIGIAAHSNGTKLYVANSSSNNISVINTTSNTVTNTITAGTTPSGISFNNGGSKMYVCNYSSGTVSIFNTSTDVLSGTIAAGSGPYSYGNFIMTYTDSPLVANVCNSYTWHGNTYTQSGTYTYSQTNAVGCDSITTLNLTVRYSSNSSSTATGAYSYTLGSSTFYTTGIYTLTFTNSQGCDSIHTLNLTMTANSGSSVVSTCNSYTWNGTTFTVSGNYTGTFMNVAGYDSIHTLHLSINNNIPNIQKAFVPNYNSNTVSVINLLNNSIIATIPVGTGPSTIEVSPDGNKVYVGNITSNTISVINTSTNTVIKTVALSNTPYQLKSTPDGSKLLISTYNLPMLSMNTSSYSVTTAFTATSSAGDFTFSPDGSKLYVCFYTFGNSKINVYNTSNYSLISSYAIGASNPISITCSNDGTILYVINYTSSGPCSVQVFNSANGSLLNTIQTGQNSSRLALHSSGNKLYVSNKGENTVSVINTVTNTVSQTINVNSSPYAMSFNNSNSKLFVCNEGSNNVSVINTSTDVVSNTISVGSGPRGYGNFIPVMSGVFTTDACNSFTWNGLTYTNTGIYTYTATNASGCDSISTLNLTIKHSSTASASVTACNTYTLGSTTYTNSGVYTPILVNAEGCDSIVTLTLTINHSNTASSAVSACISYLFNGTTYTVGGTYIGHFTNASGCDSTHTLILTINSLINVSSYVHACNSYAWNGSTLTASGVYTATFSTPGCDSIHKLTLELDRNSAMEPRAFIPNLSTNSVTVVNLVSNQVITTIPVGAGPSAVAFNPSKSRVYVSNSSAGTVSVILTATNSVIATVALGSSSNIKGIVVSNDGSKIFVAHNATPAKISVIDAATFTVSTTISLATQVNALCKSPDGSKIYAQTTNSGIIYIINTSTYAVTSVTLSSFSASNMVINSTGTKLFLIGSSNVVASYNLLTNASTFLSLPSEGYPMSALTLSPDGTKLYVGKGGGNRIATVNTTTNTLASTTIIGVWPYSLATNADGSKLYIVSTNLLTMNLSPDFISNTTTIGGLPQSISNFIGAGPAPTPVISACNSYTWNGNTYTSSGIYSQTYTNASGCDSVATINLIINYPPSPLHSYVTACNSYTFAGITYTNSGIYTVLFPLPSGCDSTHVLHLTIKHSTSAPTLNISACSNYTWYGVTYVAGGTYINTYINAEGCDSISTLNLNITGIPNFAYVASYDSDIVNVIDLSTNTIVNKIPVGDGPYAVVVSPDGNRVYIANQNSQNVSVVNTHTNSVIATISLGIKPFNAVISPDGNVLYVNSITHSKISVINTNSLSVTTTLNPGYPTYAINISTDGTKLFVVNSPLLSNSYNIKVLSTANFTSIATIPLPNYITSILTSLSVNPDGIHLYANLSEGLFIIHLPTNSVQMVSNLGSLIYSMCMSPNGNLLYLSMASPERLKVMDVATNTFLNDISIGFHPTDMNSNPSNGNLCLVNSSNHLMYIYDVLNNSFQPTIPITGSPKALGKFILDAGHKTIYSCNSYTWHGVTYTSTGNYTSTQTNSNGCDTVETLHLTIKSTTYASANITTCNSYIWDGITYTNNGVYSNTYTNYAGCDSIHTINLTINHANIQATKGYITSSSLNTVTVVDLKNNIVLKTVPVASSPSRALLNTNGSKAYILFTSSSSISVINTSTDTVEASVAVGLTVNSIALSRDGSKLYALCGNSIRVINTASNNIMTTFNLSDTYTEITVSPDDTKIYLIGNGTPGFKAINANSGSIISTQSAGTNPNYICVKPDGSKIYITNTNSNNVTVINANNFNVEASIPVGQYPRSLAINPDGTKLFVSNINTANISVIRTDLNIVDTTINVNYNPGGIMVSDDGSKFYVVASYNGSKIRTYSTTTYARLDSIAFGINLTSYGNFATTFPSVTNQTACGSFNWNGINYTHSGLYTQVFQVSAGCDSSSRLNLNIVSSTNGSSSITACNSYAWNGNTYTSSGSYTDVFSTPGCDSTHTLNLTIHHSNSNSISISACDSYVWNGNTYTSSGNYISTFTNQESCDSVVTLQLTIHLSSSSSSTMTASNLYTWPLNGVTYTSSGTYTYTYLNNAGCTHTATLHLIITNTSLSSIDAFEDQTVSCYGFNNGSCQTSAFPNGNYTYQLDGGIQSNNIGFFSGLTPGMHTVCATDGINTICDTVFIHEPAALNISFNVDSLVSCQGHDGGLSAIITGGTTVLQGYVTTWKDASNTILNPAPANFANYVSGLDSGVYSLTIEDDHGCFLTQSTTLGSAAPLVVTGNYTNILCNGESSVISPSASGGSGNSVITINGFALQSSYPAGTYTITAVDERACSASAIITINEPASTNTSLSISTCDTYTWSENGITYTSSGMYTHSSTNSAGCVGIATLNLTIFNSHHFNSTISSVNTYTWPVNGMTYTTSGTYAASYINQHGCDSNYTLHLTITGIAIAPKLMLSGAYDQFTGLMYDSLRTKNLIPLMEPYSNPPYNKPQIGGPGGETTSNSVLSVNGNDAIVDWVFIEIRSAANPSTIVATKRALLQRDGDVVNEDGSSALYFNTIEQGNYYISVKHRNHLGVMTASSFALNYTPTIVDFKSSMPVYTMASILYNAPRKLVNGVYLLWAGDANNNKNIKFNGLSNDKDMVINAVGAGTPNNILTAYRTEDVNMDGKVKYNNADNDKNFILLQLGVNTPNAVYSQHTVN